MEICNVLDLRARATRARASLPQANAGSTHAITGNRTAGAPLAMKVADNLADNRLHLAKALADKAESYQLSM